MTFRCAVSGTALAAHAVRPRQHMLLLYSTFLLAPTLSPTKSQQTTQHQPKPFHTTACLRDEQIDNSRNHYETLKLQPGATPAEIKKSFYALSKTHHPDVNPSSPHASRRFMRISEAYSVLSIPAKRAAYDRDVLRLHQPSPSSHPPHRGSYSSTSNPAGGRPPSGLSRRRGPFQGPPPSFYRSGGWGAHGAKRRAAHDESTGSGSSSSSTSSSSSSAGARANSFGAGGMGPGQTPYGRGAEDDVSHFDRASHERTGRHIDRRRAARRAGLDGSGTHVDVESERGTAGMFFLIGGVLALSVLGPYAIGRMWTRGSGGGGGSGARDRDTKLDRKS
ncbi:DnaJ-domain-containing protein [Daldinia caldariorum]|uniref:DnaJ-domain-containing protein n=1 Tax=Daldinia caldariorum TaxID=326644 RepID=UPI0020076AD9|nr:DnaJ-domain-containing protein [Daldinia caldariorum]KAI1467934.1 DnaJ-domain-containing protein [Daldinia caldariorum]